MHRLIASQCGVLFSIHMFLVVDVYPVDPQNHPLSVQQPTFSARTICFYLSRLIVGYLLLCAHEGTLTF